MYSWIWRHLPYGRAGKLAGSLLLAIAALALLWYVVFPAIDPHLPFNNDGQVTNGQPRQGDDVVPPSPTP